MCVFAQTLWDTWTVAYQAPLFMRFPRQEYLSGLTFPPSRNLPHPGIKPTSATLAGRFLPLHHLGSLAWTDSWIYKHGAYEWSVTVGSVIHPAVCLLSWDDGFCSLHVFTLTWCHSHWHGGCQDTRTWTHTLCLNMLVERLGLTNGFPPRLVQQ